MISSSTIPVPSRSRNPGDPTQDPTNLAELTPLSSSSSHPHSHMEAHHRDRPSTRGSDTSGRSDLYYATQPSTMLSAGEPGSYMRDDRRDSYTTYDTALPAGSAPLETLTPAFAPALDSALVTSSIPSNPLPVIDRVPLEVDYRSSSPVAAVDRHLEAGTRGETSATTTTTQITTTESTSASAPAVTETDLTGGTTSSSAAVANPALAGTASHADNEFVAPEAKLGRRVVVLAMDDSTASQAALTWTLNQLVSPSRDHLIILTVAHYKTAGLLKTNEEKTARRELKAEEQAQIVVNYAAAHIAQWIESLKISLSFELVTLKAADGKVQEVITDYARDINSNVLILGSHAGGAIRKTLFGSTATYCLTHATTPVIVVREEGTVMAA